jgi:hypothetical protein
MKQKLVGLLVIILFASTLLVAPPVAQASTTPPLQVTLLTDGVRIRWQHVPAARLSELRPGATPLITIGGMQVPGQLVALRISGDGSVIPQIEQLESVPWYGSLPAATTITPHLVGGEPRPALAASASSALPTAPVVVLRESRLRGVRVAVLALSRVFAAPQGLRSLTSLSFTIPGATPLPADSSSLLDTAGPFLVSAPPSNPAAGVGWKIQVTQAGIQRVTAAALSAAGVSLAQPQLLQLHYAGTEVALEQRGTGSNLEFRFYAPAPGDRWNSTDIYWLTLGTAPGLRMAGRSVAPGSAPLSGFAFERGVWRDNKLYDSLLAGPDGDHWFATDMRVAPLVAGQPPEPPAVTQVLITPTLTLVNDTTTITTTGSSYLDTTHTLNVTLANTTLGAAWSGIGDWSHTMMFPAPSKRIQLTLLPSSAADGYEIDSIAWQVPVLLDLHERGAAFTGRVGSWRYQLENILPGSVLYDVSDPLKPALLSNLLVGNAANTQFEDGSEDGSEVHQYVLAGPGTLFAPTITRSPAFDMATPARVLYIAPAALRSALAPLLTHRQTQGLSVRAIDVQAIYDRWSYGQVSPQAIRDFLRYTAATWATPPIAVTLVGDGTIDPKNYTKRNNTNYIPPFQANVDPWLGETACEQCFVRLDGDDATVDMLPDMTLGRLPVRSPSEVTALVSKIVTYETSPLNLLWRSQAVYVADNYLDAQDQPDIAGDFAAFANASVALQPEGMTINRLYYDPSPTRPAQPWREPNAARAYQRTLGLLNAGAGLVNYIGHGSQYQWAVTDYSANPPYLLGQYDPDDLTNGTRQPILLELTCLTAAFQTPSYGGTIDERLLLNSAGGAIAVWGPTGQGVSHGHDSLQLGFYTKLWSSPPLSARVGALALAGYTELFTNGFCCQDAISTYALLGDAMQLARVEPSQSLYVPVARKS